MQNAGFDFGPQVWVSPSNKPRGANYLEKTTSELSTEKEKKVKEEFLLLNNPFFKKTE